MSQASVLYDLPGPRARRRYAILGVALDRRHRRRCSPGSAGSFYDTGQFEAAQMGAVHSTSRSSRTCSTGLLDHAQGGRHRRRAGAGLRRGVRQPAGSATTWILRAPATVVVELFRAIPLLILIFFIYYGPPYGSSRQVLAAGHRPDPLQRLGAGRDLPGRHQRRAPRPDRGRVRARPAQVQVHALDPAAAGVPLDAAGDRQPARGAAQGHRARLHHHLPGAALRRQADRRPAGVRAAVRADATWSSQRSTSPSAACCRSSRGGCSGGWGGCRVPPPRSSLPRTPARTPPGWCEHRTRWGETRRAGWRRSPPDPSPFTPLSPTCIAPQRAISVTRDSRTTVTRICPG